MVHLNLPSIASVAVMSSIAISSSDAYDTPDTTGAIFAETFQAAELPWTLSANDKYASQTVSLSVPREGTVEGFEGDTVRFSLL